MSSDIKLGMNEPAEIVKSENEAFLEFNAKLAALISRAAAAQVTDAATCLEAKQIEADIKSYQKAVELSDFARDVAAKREAWQKANAKVDTLLAPAESALAPLTRRRRAWEEQERRAAEEETRRKNEIRQREAREKAEAERKAREKEIEKQRKAGEIGKREAAKLKESAAQEATEAAANVQEVYVAPSIPKVAGVPQRRNWRFEVVDATKIPRKYLLPDESSIGYMVRVTKDQKKAEAECPGIRVWSE